MPGDAEMVPIDISLVPSPKVEAVTKEDKPPKMPGRVFLQRLHGEQKAPLNGKKPSPSANAENDSPSASSQAVEHVAQADALAEAPADGTPDGSQTILAQIAQCLPEGVRPSLTQEKLNLRFDSKGNLAGVPRMDIDLNKSTPDDIVATNLIIQAALQCGPYAVPQKVAQNFSIVPDFRSLPGKGSALERGLVTN